MTSDLLTPGLWPTFVLVSTRLTGMILVTPFWSLSFVPRTIRGATVVVLSAILTPLVPPVSAPDHPVALPVPVLSELVIGLAIGLAAALVSQALTLASEVVALQMGLSLGQLFTPSADTGGAGLSQLYGLLGLAVFVAIGGPTDFVEAVARSFDHIPPGTIIAPRPTAMAMLASVGRLFGYAIQIAGPVMLAVTAANLAIAIVSRAVPQLNAMAMSFAVTVGVGLMMLGVSLTALAGLAGRWYSQAPATAAAVVRELAPGEAR